MSTGPTERELVDIVQRLKEADGTQEELDALLDTLKMVVPFSDVSDLIFGAQRDLSAQEIVRKALACEVAH